MKNKLYIGLMDTNFALSSPCGLFCPACAIFIATKNNDISRLKKQAQELGLSIEDTKCYGCRSDKRSKACTNCKMYDCTQKQNLHFCSECASFPCNHLQQWQSVKPHRIELWKDFKTIQEKGYKEWMKISYNHYACQKCGTLNSAFDKSCTNCNTVPASDYIKYNLQEIQKRSSKS